VRGTADAEKVIELQPSSTDGWYHKGFALYHKKNFSEAVRGACTKPSLLSSAVLIALHSPQASQDCVSPRPATANLLFG
jgi:hypothetical protein